jgi:hypothetical protein
MNIISQEIIKKFYEEYKSEDSYPIVLLLYFDDFLKYTKSPKKSGGIYLGVLNFSRSTVSQPLNIFTLSLILSKEECENLIKNFINEINELNETHSIKIVGGKFISVKCFLLIISSDKPQRYDSCSLKRNTTDMNCSRCENTIQENLIKRLEYENEIEENCISFNYRNVLK